MRESDQNLISPLAAKIKKLLGDQCTVDLAEQYKAVIGMGHMTVDEARDLLHRHYQKLELREVSRS